MLAAVYISEKRFENCFLTLDRIAFDKLTPSDQNKYFELLLYGRLMSGDISQANEIFVSAEHYFKRGLLDKRNGQMLFTLGLLEYFNERFEAAVKFFDSAEKSRDADKTLRCNCELYKGECFLAQGDVRSAKASAEKSAALVSDDKQEAQLGKLMTQVEKAYIRTKEKSADTKADNTTGRRICLLRHRNKYDNKRTQRLLLALADSVPGVSGGTIAFLLGFYDSFINSLNDIMGRDNAKRKKAFLSYKAWRGLGDRYASCSKRSCQRV